jgi:hypothetical protein
MDVNGSYEHSKVNQMWQSILTLIFPWDDGYLVARDAWVGDQKPSVDLIVKRLKKGDFRPTVVFTMLNERSGSSWKDAFMQLKNHLRTQRQAGTYGGQAQYCAVGIEKEV